MDTQVKTEIGLRDELKALFLRYKIEETDVEAILSGLSLSAQKALI